MWKRLLGLVLFAWMLSISSASAQNMRFGFSFGLLEQIDTSNFATAPFPFGAFHLEVDVQDHWSIRINASPFIVVNQLGVDALYYFQRTSNSFYLGAGLQGMLSILNNTNFLLAPRVLVGYRVIFSEKMQFFVEGDAAYAVSLSYSPRFILFSLYVGLMFPI